MVSARNFVKGKAGTVVIIAGIVLGGAYLAKHFNVGSKVISAVQGAGNITGQGIVAPFTGILQGINTGGQGLVSQLTDIQKNLSNQIAATTDSFNKAIHPDWYNADGSYSQSNPNYKPQGPINSSTQGGLVQTSPSIERTSAATQSLDFTSFLNAANIAARNVIRDAGNISIKSNYGSIQPLNTSVGLTDAGTVRTGRNGLSDAQVQKDIALSKLLAGPVFDVNGNIVAVNGVSFV